MVVAIHKNQGFITVALLVLMTGVVLMGGSKIKAINQERYNFYGQNISQQKEQELLAKDVFFFNFNSYIVKESDRVALLAHSRKLLRQPKLTILISGHTDSKGARKYNLRLGLLRAKAIADLLESKGVNINRINIISYGDQIPAINTISNFADLGRLNRRVEIVYQFKVNNNQFFY